MILKNNSTKIIGIKDTSILPGETGVCPEGYENNPVVKKYINDGTFTVIQDDKDKAVNHDAEEPAGTEESPNNVDSAAGDKKAKKAASAQKGE